MTPTFSILHATLGRPKKAAEAMERWFDRAANPAAIEYIFACNGDDPAYIDLLREIAGVYIATQRMPLFVVRDFHGSAPAWDAAAKISNGQILIQGQDDVEPPPGWDELIRFRLPVASIETGSATLTFPNSNIPTFVAVSDGYRKDRLCCTAIMNRARYQQQGEFLHAGYLSVFSDDEVTYRAYRDQRDGKCTVVEARDLFFLHRHHYHDPSVPMDATYAKENSSEAYRIGGALFAQRNPEAYRDGIRDWK